MYNILVLLDPGSNYETLGELVHLSMLVASFLSVPHEACVILGNNNNTNLRWLQELKEINM